MKPKPTIKFIEPPDISLEESMKTTTEKERKQRIMNEVDKNLKIMSSMIMDDKEKEYEKCACCDGKGYVEVL